MVISGCIFKDRSNNPAGRGFSPSTQSILPHCSYPPAKKGWFSQKFQQISMFEHQGSMGDTLEAVDLSPHKTTLRLKLNVNIPFDKNGPLKWEPVPVSLNMSIRHLLSSSWSNSIFSGALWHHPRLKGNWGTCTLCPLVLPSWSSAHASQAHCLLLSHAT